MPESDERRTYLPAVAYLDDQEYWLLQYSNGQEGIVLDGACIPIVRTFSQLAKVADERGIPIHEEDTLPIELDVVAHWLERPTLDTVDPAIFLDAWDLFADLAHTLGEPDWGTDPDSRSAYEKLFWGSTTLIDARQGDTAQIGFSGPEAVRLRQTLRRGLDLFRSHLAS